jgi:Na+/H+ antiporter NhaD/arsenite permease-like protein
MAEWLDKNVHNVWLVAAVSGLLSSVTDTFTIALTGVSLYSVADAGSLQLVTDSDYLAQFAQNGIYWKLTAYATAVGGSLLTIGSTSGLALMKMEHLRLGWYFRKVMPMVFCGFVLGFAILYLETLLLQ